MTLINANILKHGDIFTVRRENGEKLIFNWHYDEERGDNTSTYIMADPVTTQSPLISTLVKLKGVKDVGVLSTGRCIGIISAEQMVELLSNHKQKYDITWDNDQNWNDQCWIEHYERGALIRDIESREDVWFLKGWYQSPHTWIQSLSVIVEVIGNIHDIEELLYMRDGWPTKHVSFVR